jgi:hypothetical protein
MRAMSEAENPILVRSHVARDLLQTAALFKTDRAVVAEYVANAMEYVDEGTIPVISVTLDSRLRRIEVADNARGMNREGLQNFFLMHGENLDRKRGRGRRGVFGTGKSAAFGIADVLRITSTRDGRRWKVELNREDIQHMGTDAPIPVRELEGGVRVNEPNGTVVEIEGIHLRSLDQSGIIRHIERNLAGWARAAQIVVNGHQCEFREPISIESRVFVADASDYPRIAGCELTVKVSPMPLESDEIGVSVTSAGVLYERTLGGNERRPMSELIFGQLEVTALQADTSPIAAFDQSRSLRLNPDNPLVHEILGFVGSSVDVVRRELLRREKDRRATEEAKAWDERAKEIERIINADFSELRGRVSRVRSRVKGDAPSLGGDAAAGEPALVEGGPHAADIVEPVGGPGVSGDGGGGDGGPPRSLGPHLEETTDGTVSADRSPVASSGGARRGGFAVEFKPLGPDEKRASYVREGRVIYVNLDHPQLVAARGSAGAPHLVLRRLAYEIAFTEYAIALASELAAQDEYFEITDPIVAIRESINRLATKAAHLYSPVTAEEL